MRRRERMDRAVSAIRSATARLSPTRATFSALTSTPSVEADGLSTIAGPLDVLPDTPRLAYAFGGSAAAAHAGTLEAEPVPWHDQPCSAEVALPPLAAVWFVPEGQAPQPHAH